MCQSGAPFCPAFHREYVVSGRILYRLEEGGSVEGKAGDYLVIEPGHAAERGFGLDEQRLDRGFVTDIGLLRQRAATRGRDRIDHGCGGQRVLEIGQHDGNAGLAQRQRAGLADPRFAAGHDRDRIIPLCHAARTHGDRASAVTPGS